MSSALQRSCHHPDSQEHKPHGCKQRKRKPYLPDIKKRSGGPGGKLLHVHAVEAGQQAERGYDAGDNGDDYAQLCELLG